MPTIYDLKPAFQARLRPIVADLANKKVTANQVTLTALALSLLYGCLLALWPMNTALLLMLPLVLFVRMALNAIDGMLAREHHMKSPLGAMLNEISDVLADVALYLPFALIADLSGTAVVLLVCLGIMVEMIGVVAVQIGAERRYDGPLGKSDRAFLFGAIALWLGLGGTSGWLLDGLLWLALALSALTLYNRAQAALRQVSHDQPD